MAGTNESDESLIRKLPSVNRRSGSSRWVTYGGVLFLIVCGVALLVVVAPHKSKSKSKQDEVARVTNNLPPLELPRPDPPPEAVKPGPKASAPQGNVQPIPLKQPQQSQAHAYSSVSLKPERTWLDRKQQSPILVGSSTSNGSAAATAAIIGRTDETTNAGGRGASDLAVKLDIAPTRLVSATRLPDRNFVITKGTTLDCALETAMDSSLPGITTCRLTRDIYSDNGQVLLLERGSQLVGEYAGGMKTGQTRLFVVWTRVKTPLGIVVSLNSPGADELGRSGHEGEVDNHFFDRFGAAILTSLLKDTTAAALERRNVQGNNGTVIYSGGSSYANTVNAGEQIIVKMLDATANIPPTLTKKQGDHIQVMVARDLDFSGVYALKVEP